jgi:hypothetical protein
MFSFLAFKNKSRSVFSKIQKDDVQRANAVGVRDRNSFRKVSDTIWIRFESYNYRKDIQKGLN